MVDFGSKEMNFSFTCCSFAFQESKLAIFKHDTVLGGVTALAGRRLDST